MQSVTNIGYAHVALTHNFKSAVPVEHTERVTMGLLKVLEYHNDAIYREEGLRVHVCAVLGEYRVMMIYQGGVYEGMNRISKVYKFLVELGIPVSHGWERFYV